MAQWSAPNSTGHGDSYGYGRFDWGGRRRVQAHRAAWMVERGPIPAGMKICHRCDNRTCVRIDHLFLGTQADNIADMVTKGRHHEGSKTHCDNGHEYTDDNTYRPVRGGRKCRTCARESERRRRGGEQSSSSSPTLADQP
jgi:hypothetical protein